MTRVQMIGDYRSAAADGVTTMLYAAESYHDVPLDVAERWEAKGVALIADGQDENTAAGGTDLDALGVPELKQLAAERGVDLTGKKKKDDIIDALNAPAVETSGLEAPETQALDAAPETK